MNLLLLVLLILVFLVCALSVWFGVGQIAGGFVGLGSFFCLDVVFLCSDFGFDFVFEMVRW